MAVTRLMLDNDGSNFLGSLGDDVEGAIAEMVRDCPAEVTTYLLCSAAGTCYFPTEVGCPAPAAAALHRRGLDPLGMFLRRLKAAGKETFITYRMNDVHNPTDADAWNTPRLRREHPDYVVGAAEIAAGKGEWMSYCLDYGRPEVRRYVLELIAEQIDRYGDTIDGFQLDWMRFPRHLSGTPEQVWDQRGTLVEFLCQVRAVLHRNGRRILLGVRVPTSPAGCRRLGFDLAAWGGQSLVDLVVACPFLTTEWLVPIESLRAWLGNPAVPVVGGFDFGFGRQPHFPESLRGIAASLLSRGSDGVYLFNFPCWTEYLATQPYHWLQGLMRQGAAAAKPLLVAVEHAQHRIAGVDQPAQLPAELAAGATLDLTVYVPPAALPVRRALLLVHSHGDIAVGLNGAAPVICGAGAPGPTRRGALFGEVVTPDTSPDLWVRPDDCRICRLGPGSLAPGVNRLRVANLTDGTLAIERANLGLW